ncbi:MAG: hypothetical protein JXA50_00055 [Deltaproteobacteria bacterium]|nr:hypothetical protein [Deltaproteobacteria bacterium]
MWRQNPITATENSEISQSERRVISRVHTAIPLTINFAGTMGAPPPVTVQTADISPKGLSTIITLRIVKVKDGQVLIQEEVKNSAKMIKYLLTNRIVGLGIHILPQGGSVHAMGTVKWYARNVNDELYSLKAGIVLDEIDRADKREWFYFFRAIYEHLACFHREGGNGGSVKSPVDPD